MYIFVHLQHGAFAPRLGHLGEDNLKKLLTSRMVNRLEQNLEGHVKGCCEGCKEGKHHRDPFPNDEEKAVRKKLDLIQSDIKGPITPNCHGGYKYSIALLDVGKRKIGSNSSNTRMKLWVSSSGGKMRWKGKTREKSRPSGLIKEENTPPSSSQHTSKSVVSGKNSQLPRHHNRMGELKGSIG
jgi:hypothetical protein